MKKTIALLCALVMAVAMLPAISLAELNVDTNSYHVEIHFVDIYDLNIELAEPIIGTYEFGTEIEYTYPVVEGYYYETAGEAGTYLVTGAADVYIKYLPDTHTVTVYYQFTDGSEAYPTYFEEVLYGRPYYQESPVIEHYTADILVVEGTMGTEDVVVYVTYVGEPCTITIHLVDEDGEPVGDDIVITVPYGEDFYQDAPEIPGYTPTEPGVGGTAEGDAEYTIVYAADPVPPTVEGTRAELRARPTQDAYRDLRFIFTVHFNDSYVEYEGEKYGPTYQYYVIDRFFSVLNTDEREVTIEGINIFTMYEDLEGEPDENIFTYTAVLRGVKPRNFATMVTATPYITYSWNGVTVTDDGPALTNCVDDFSNAD